jgi:hypothetical protein
MRSGLPPFSQMARVASDGTFQASSLPAGTYTVCVQADGFVDPCQWSLPTLVITVANGETSKGNNLTIRFGSVTKLRIEDPSRLLAATTKDGRKPHVLAGVFNAPSAPSIGKIPLPPPPVQFHLMNIAGQDAAGTNYEILTPRDRLLRTRGSMEPVLILNRSTQPWTRNPTQWAIQQGMVSPHSKSTGGSA